MGILEKIKEIEAEMARTQKNKATNGHLGALKARIAKLRGELLEGYVLHRLRLHAAPAPHPPTHRPSPNRAAGGGGGGEGFDVARSGDGRVALIGFPSVGKSSLLNELTDTESVAAAYVLPCRCSLPPIRVRPPVSHPSLHLFSLSPSLPRAGTSSRR